jgi:hypothetical protein
MELELRYKKEKGQSAEYNNKTYCLQYVWWLEDKVLALEKKLNKNKSYGKCSKTGLLLVSIQENCRYFKKMDK